jgi:DNA mismatch repair protein MutS2
MKLDQQSAKDLEFDKVKLLLSNYCKSNKAKNNSLKIRPFNSLNDLKGELSMLEEVCSIYEDDTIVFPHPNSEDIDHALKLLDIKNGVLILDELIKIYQLCLGTKQIIDFSKKHKNTYPLVYEACSHITSVQNVLSIIEQVLNPKLTIKDDATQELFKIRTQQKSNQIAINRNFEKVLASYRKSDVLADTEETFYENRRLLTVLSAQKKKVKGKVHGMSSKGVYTYVEPAENVLINKEQEKLYIEESNEIFKILKEITDQLRAERGNLEAFQRLLIRFDMFNAKVLFAKTYNGVNPKIRVDQKMYWRGAIHPLLYLKHEELGLSTIGQELELQKDKRFLVVSGPNAGGKSVTLKTVGLLQLMFQCGIFVPVDDVSEFCWFDNILSDIGDNQSIDNQLSTYSYRLSRMKYFLETVKENTLVLLDEFGSGSDPELGGALAEVFYEKLYATKCFAVINTHYTNIKILTSSLAEAVNACMLFDTVQLKPLYKLSIGQPGSSFTFEVARLIGIPANFIADAKEKVSESKVKLDDLATSLQQEKSKFNKMNKIQIQTSSEARLLIRDYEGRLEKLINKSEQQIKFFEQQTKFTQAGKKIFDLIGKFKSKDTNQQLNAAVKKFVTIEKSKALENENTIVLDKKIKQQSLPKLEKKVLKNETVTEKPKPIKKLKLGDRVKITNYSKSGILQEIKGEKVIVQIGNFTVKALKKDLFHP